MNILGQARHWDEATRRVVLARVNDVPPPRFFTADEAKTLQLFCDLVTGHDTEPLGIPVLNFVDAKLFAGELDGYRYADTPDDRDTWRLVARGLDAAAGLEGAVDFAHATKDVQRNVIEGLADGALRGEVWDELPCGRAWTVVMRGVLGAFYAHPSAWDEIGFGGPAYPRAKASPLVTHVPDAIAHGAEIRDGSMASEIEVDEASGRVVGVSYFADDGTEQVQSADMVAIAGYSIETPRLLLNSSSRRFPHGLGNNADQVGRYVMVQGAPPGRRSVRRRAADVQGAAAGDQLRAVLRDRPGPQVRARVLDPNGRTTADRLGRACPRRRPLGHRAARAHA